jgi:hypothetical protein
MRESDLRPVLLVKAIEESDGDATLLPPSDRAAAAREAKREAPPRDALRLDEGVLPRDAERLLAKRAHVLVSQLRVRHPFVQDIVSFAPGWWLAVAACVVAFAMGIALSALDGSKRINVLAFPLWAVVSWNLCIYAIVAMSWIRAARARRRARRWIPEWIASAGMRRVSAIVARARHFHAPLARALAKFAADWQEAARPVLVARAAAMFHVAAALLGIGLIAGFYVRGIALDYRAGWESTFLGPDAARTVLRILYGPASALTGIPVPDAAHVESIRWRDGTGGESAAPWIHLLAATTFVFVVLPRSALALLAALWGVRAARNLRLPASFAGYFDRTFAEAGVAIEGGGLRVIPYAYDPAAESIERLRRQSPDAAIDVRSPIAYGAEEGIAAAVGDGEAPAAIALLFTSAATPEEEAHGRAIDAAREAARRGAIRVEAIVDEGPYRERMGDALAARVDERRQAWSRLATSHGVDVRFVDLSR